MILIDYSNVSISAITAEAHRAKGVDWDHTLFSNIVWKNILDIKQRFPRDIYGECVIVADSLTGYWRHKVFPHYKGTRKELKENFVVDWKELKDSCNQTFDDLDKYSPMKCIRVNNAEADDIIYYLGTTQPGKHVIVSKDKDLLQIKNSDVKQWSTLVGGFLDGSEYDLAEHILRGDRGDGIPNILTPEDAFMEKIRSRSITKNILADWNENLMLEDFLEKYEADDRYEVNRQLIDMRYMDDDVWNHIASTWKSIKKEPTKTDSRKLYSFLKQNGKDFLLRDIILFS